MTELEKLEAESERITTWIATLPAHNGARGLRESGQRMLERVDEKIQMLALSPPVNAPGPGEGPIKWSMARLEEQDEDDPLAVKRPKYDTIAVTRKVTNEPIAWPLGDESISSVIINPRIEIDRQRVTAGGPKAFFQPQQFKDRPFFYKEQTLNENGYAPGDTQEQVPLRFVGSPAEVTATDRLLAELKAEYEAKEAEIKARITTPTPPAHPRTKIPANPKIGIVICTHRSVPYVHLGLEALSRNEPDVKVLVHDDCSVDKAEIEELARRYGADFVSTVSRRIPTVGDLSGFAEGLKWGKYNGLDIVVKCSRSYIINKKWSEDLGALMHNTQIPSATGACAFWQWGWRAELVAMHTRSWIDCGAFAMMEAAVEANEPYAGLPESYSHDRAKEAYRWLHPADDSVSHWTDRDNPDCDFTVRYDMTYPHNDNHAGFVPWFSVMGLHRNQRVPGTLWHDNAGPYDYVAMANDLDLKYSPQDFERIPGE